MKKALILFGGCSSEHDVSLVSAKSVIENTPKDKYELVLIGISKDGRWLKFDGDVSLLPEDKWLEDEEHLTPAVISVDKTDHGIIVLGKKTEKIYIDVCFPVLHGKNGEDGTVQGLLQLSGIPFVGCDMLASACCMDKAVTNTLIDNAGIKQAKWLGLKDFEYRKNQQYFVDKIKKQLGYPVFVKPANAGSSVGVSKAVDDDSLRKAIDTAFKEDCKLVIEEGISGIEIECAVLGNEEPIASVVGEIVPANDFYDYEAKYINAASELYIPARITESKANEVRFEAINVYKALGCSGLSRVDFFVENDSGEVLLNEVNTIPGFTSISMYPKLFGASGIEYGELIDKLFCCAVDKWEK